MKEALQELSKVQILAAEISAKKIRFVDVIYSGSVHLVEVAVRPPAQVKAPDFKPPKADWIKFTWLDSFEALSKLRKVRHDLEQLLAGSQTS